MVTLDRRRPWLCYLLDKLPALSPTKLGLRILSQSTTSYWQTSFLFLICSTFLWFTFYRHCSVFFLLFLFQNPLLFDYVFVANPLFLNRLLHCVGRSHSLQDFWRKINGRCISCLFTPIARSFRKDHRAPTSQSIIHAYHTIFPGYLYTSIDAPSYWNSPKRNCIELLFLPTWYLDFLRYALAITLFFFCLCAFVVVRIACTAVHSFCLLFRSSFYSLSLSFCFRPLLRSRIHLLVSLISWSLLSLQTLLYDAITCNLHALGIDFASTLFKLSFLQLTVDAIQRLLRIIKQQLAIELFAYTCDAVWIIHERLIIRAWHPLTLADMTVYILRNMYLDRDPLIDSIGET